MILHEVEQSFKIVLISAILKNNHLEETLNANIGLWEILETKKHRNHLRNLGI